MPQIVCIGRQYGSGGREVGERLAKLLNIPCYDKVEEDCVARVMQRNSLNAQDAAKRIRQVNRMRKKYHAFYADSDWGQTDSYDLMLSTSKLGIDGCVELLRNALTLPKEGDAQ